MAARRGASLDLARFLASCASGQELPERGLAQDVELAAQVDVSQTVPRLRKSALRAWSA